MEMSDHQYDVQADMREQAVSSAIMFGFDYALAVMRHMDLHVRRAKWPAGMSVFMCSGVMWMRPLPESRKTRWMPTEDDLLAEDWDEA